MRIRKWRLCETSGASHEARGPAFHGYQPSPSAERAQECRSLVTPRTQVREDLLLGKDEFFSARRAGKQCQRKLRPLSCGEMDSSPFPSVDKLSDELWLHILSFLDAKELVQAASVSSALHRVRLSPALMSIVILNVCSSRKMIFCGRRRFARRRRSPTKVRIHHGRSLLLHRPTPSNALYSLPFTRSTISPAPRTLCGPAFVPTSTHLTAPRWPFSFVKSLLFAARQSSSV